MYPEFTNYLRKPLIRFVELGLLIALTVFAYIIFLHCANYLWFVFSSTDVGQKYAEIYQESNRITQDVLSKDFINLAIHLTLTSCIICLAIGAILKFVHLIQFFYLGRGVFGRIIFSGLPLTYIVSIYLHYTGNFSHIDAAYVVAFVPTLFLFSGCFKLAEEFVPEFIDMVHIFSGKRESTYSVANGVESPKLTNTLFQKNDSLQRVPARKTKLQDILEFYAVPFVVFLMIVALAGIMFLLLQIPFPHMSWQKNTAIVDTTKTCANANTEKEHKPVPSKKEISDDGRFIAYADRTVLDTKTGLMWAADESETLSWNEARTYCNNFRGGGYSDWRMPSITELAGLYDETMQPECGCVTHLIEMYNGPNCWEWSSETKDSDAAILAFNLNGKQWMSQENNSSVHVRPVRNFKNYNGNKGDGSI